MSHRNAGWVQYQEHSYSIGSKLNHVVQNLTNEILCIILKGPLHTRGIADALGTSHATVLRKLRILVDENVVDFTIEGKNKVYYLKKNIEGGNAALTAELYKLSRLVSQYPLLRGMLQAVMAERGVKLALIFGSYAKGTAHQESDIDLFIETDDRDVKKRLEGQYSTLSVKIGRFDTDHPLVREIIKDHIIVKGGEEFFEKTRFFT